MWFGVFGWRSGGFPSPRVDHDQEPQPPPRRADIVAAPVGTFDALGVDP
jgi:hypothetical protein